MDLRPISITGYVREPIKNLPSLAKQVYHDTMII